MPVEQNTLVFKIDRFIVIPPETIPRIWHLILRMQKGMWQFNTRVLLRMEGLLTFTLANKHNSFSFPATCCVGGTSHNKNLTTS